MQSDLENQPCLFEDGELPEQLIEVPGWKIKKVLHRVEVRYESKDEIARAEKQKAKGWRLIKDFVRLSDDGINEHFQILEEELIYAFPLEETEKEEPKPEEGIPNQNVEVEQDLFSLESADALNQSWEEKERERLNMESRKSMNLPYYDKPQNDSERLLNYQYELLKNNNDAVWDEMLELAFKVCLNLVWAYMKKNKTRLDPVEQREKADIAMNYVLRRYKKNVGWYVTKNYIRALKDGVKHAMDYTTTIQKNTIYTDDLSAVKN